MEIGYRIEGALLSPGSKTYSYSPSVKKQLGIKKILIIYK